MPRVLSRLLKPPFRPSTLAVVDLGSNSFRLEVGRVEGDQIFRLDTWRETIRFGAGIDEKGNLTRAGAARGAGVPHALPRAAVGSASVGGARGRHQHVPRREERRDVPAAGRSRARLPDRHHRRPRGGAAHLPRRRARAAGVGQAAARDRHRRRVDRVHHRPPHDAGAPRVAEARLRQHVGALLRRAASLRADAFVAAETHARAEIEAIAREFGREHWHEAFASSGTALALAAILEENGLSAGGITPDGLARLRKRMIGAGRMSRLDARRRQARARAGAGRRLRDHGGGDRRARRAAHQPGRRRAAPGRPVRPPRPHGEARQPRGDRREHAGALPHRPPARARGSRPWRGTSISSRRPRPIPRRRSASNGRACCTRSASRSRTCRSTSTARTSSRTRTCRDSPRRTSAISRCSCWAAAAACRRWPTCSRDRDFAAQILALRLAVLFHHARRAIDTPRIALNVARTIRFGVAKRWLAAHPLTSHLLDVEREEWADLGFPWRAPVRGR